MSSQEVLGSIERGYQFNYTSVTRLAGPLPSFLPRGAVYPWPFDNSSAGCLGDSKDGLPGGGTTGSVGGILGGSLISWQILEIVP